LRVVEHDAPPRIELKHRTLVMSVRPGTDGARRHALLSLWYREQLRAAAAPVMAKWAKSLRVEVAHLFVRQMKTKWGSCNPSNRSRPFILALRADG